MAPNPRAPTRTAHWRLTNLLTQAEMGRSSETENLRHQFETEDEGPLTYSQEEYLDSVLRLVQIPGM